MGDMEDPDFDELMRTFDEQLSRLFMNDATLATLDLKGKYIRGEGFRIRVAKKIVVKRRFVLAESVRKLAAALLDNTSLHTLHLREHGIGDSGIKALMEALNVNNSLTTLTLTAFNNPIAYAIHGISRKGVRALAGMLRVNDTLTTLDIHGHGHEFGDEGANLFAEALKRNATLTTLNIGQNKISSQGVRLLAKVLKTNRTLTTLVLVNNHIGDKGANHLAEVLQVNTTLTSVELGEHSGITPVGLKALQDALQKNMSLTTFGFTDRLMTGFPEMQAILASNISRVQRWNRRKSFLMFLYFEEFNLLESSGDVYTVHHIDSPITEVFFCKDLDRFLCSFL